MKTRRIIKKRKVFLISLLIAMILVGTTVLIFSNQRGKKWQDPFYCEKNDDCVESGYRSEEDYCGTGCGENGIFINKQTYENWSTKIRKDERSKNCLIYECMQFIIFQDPICFQNQCVGISSSGEPYSFIFSNYGDKLDKDYKISYKLKSNQNKTSICRLNVTCINPKTDCWNKVKIYYSNEIAIDKFELVQDTIIVNASSNFNYDINLSIHCSEKNYTKNVKLR